ncbi:MAG: methyl-accepting chemotaxis protein [Thermoleophilia bacterium]
MGSPPVEKRGQYGRCFGRCPAENWRGALLRHVRVGPRVLAGFAGLLLLMIVACGIGMWGMSTIRDDAAFVRNDPLPAVEILSEIDGNLREVRMHQLEVLVTESASGRRETIGDMTVHADAVLEGLRAYGERISDPENERRMVAYTAEMTKYLATSDRMVTMVDRDAARRLWGENEAQFDELGKLTVEWIKYNEQRASNAIHDADRATTRGRNLLIGFTLVALAFGAAVARWITRSLTGPLETLRRGLEQVGEGDLTTRIDDSGNDEVSAVARTFNEFGDRIQRLCRQVADATKAQITLSEEMLKGAEESGQASTQIAVAMEEVARGAGDQAGATARANDTMVEISEGVRRVSAASESAAAMADDTDRTASEGADTVRDAMEAMQSIERRVTEASGIVLELGQRSAMVGQIVDTISSIASETNLLALNAAIEAARAGEQGRGFAVVADEVRKLAESTQEQVGSIAQIVGEIQERTANAVEAMENGRAEVESGALRVGAAGDAFLHIREGVEGLSSEVTSLAAAAQELDAGTAEIHVQLTSVAAVSEQNAAAVQQVSASSEQTSANAHETADSAKRVAESSRELVGLIGAFTL